MRNVPVEAARVKAARVMAAGVEAARGGGGSGGSSRHHRPRRWPQRRWLGRQWPGRRIQIHQIRLYDSSIYVSYFPSPLGQYKGTGTEGTFFPNNALPSVVVHRSDGEISSTDRHWLASGFHIDISFESYHYQNGSIKLSVGMWTFFCFFLLLFCWFIIVFFSIPFSLFRFIHFDLSPARNWTKFRILFRLLETKLGVFIWCGIGSWLLSDLFMEVIDRICELKIKTFAADPTNSIWIIHTVCCFDSCKQKNQLSLSIWCGIKQLKPIKASAVCIYLFINTFFLFHVSGQNSGA